MGEEFPRELTPAERELLFWILPEERPGYRVYRELIGRWRVEAEGRRGGGNYILAPAGGPIDSESPLPQVLAHGQVERKEGSIAVTIRERLGNQIEYEIATRGHDEGTELRRWTYSTWLPGRPCPVCGGGVRNVGMNLASGRGLVLALCALDRKLWVYDSESGINHPIPVTNFYNELMMHKNIRDPEKALDSRRLFADLADYTDQDLAHAFRTYNQVRTKVRVEEKILIDEGKKPTLFERMFGKSRS